MSHSPQELLFALRSPTSGPLAAVICALADLFEDPSFNERQGALLRELLDRAEVPQLLADRATERLTAFAAALESRHQSVFAFDTADEGQEVTCPVSEQRPRLRVVG